MAFFGDMSGASAEKNKVETENAEEIQHSLNLWKRSLIHECIIVTHLSASRSWQGPPWESRGVNLYKFIIILQESANYCAYLALRQVCSSRSELTRSAVCQQLSAICFTFERQIPAIAVKYKFVFECCSKDICDPYEAIQSRYVQQILLILYKIMGSGSPHDINIYYRTGIPTPLKKQTLATIGIFR